jgi:hypothetical protein
MVPPPFRKSSLRKFRLPEILRQRIKASVNISVLLRNLRSTAVVAVGMRRWSKHPGSAEMKRSA